MGKVVVEVKVEVTVVDVISLKIGMVAFPRMVVVVMEVVEAEMTSLKVLIMTKSPKSPNVSSAIVEKRETEVETTQPLMVKALAHQFKSSMSH